MIEKVKFREPLGKVYSCHVLGVCLIWEDISNSIIHSYSYERQLDQTQDSVRLKGPECLRQMRDTCLL